MELHRPAPKVLNFLVTMALPQPKKCEEKNIPLLCDAYGILAYEYHMAGGSLIQKINVILLPGATVSIQLTTISVLHLSDFTCSLIL